MSGVYPYTLQQCNFNEIPLILILHLIIFFVVNGCENGNYVVDVNFLFLCNSILLGMLYRQLTNLKKWLEFLVLTFLFYFWTILLYQLNINITNCEWNLLVNDHVNQRNDNLVEKFLLRKRVSSRNFCSILDVHGRTTYCRFHIFVWLFFQSSHKRVISSIG